MRLVFLTETNFIEFLALYIYLKALKVYVRMANNLGNILFSRSF